MKCTLFAFAVSAGLTFLTIGAAAADEAKAPQAPLPIPPNWAGYYPAPAKAAPAAAGVAAAPAAPGVAAPAVAPVAAPAVPGYSLPGPVPANPYVSHYAVERAVGFYVPPPLPYVWYASGSYRWSASGIDRIRIRYYWDDGVNTIDPRHRDFHGFYFTH